MTRVSTFVLVLWCGVALAGDIGKTDNDVKESTFPVRGKHCASVAQSVDKGVPHFEGVPQSDYVKDDNGKILKATISLDGTVNVPEWKDEDSTPAKYLPAIKKYLGFLKAHEERHAAIFKKTFNDVHKKLIGKTEDQANEFLKKLQCQEAKEHFALDKKEGKITLSWDAGADTCSQTITGKERPEYLKVCN